MLRGKGQVDAFTCPLPLNTCPSPEWSVSGVETSVPPVQLPLAGGFALVVQWQNTAMPRLRPGFNPRPAHHHLRVLTPAVVTQRPECRSSKPGMRVRVPPIALMPQ